MKKYVLFILACIIGFMLQAQTVPRNKVIIELGTATW
jgi:hypothetical protein